jgi:metallophosphoesterase (TIGR00282 family)
MRILFIGDIVGRPGREAIAQALPEIVRAQKISLVIANAENAAGGSGITPEVARDLFDLGVDVITAGDHIWKRREILDILPEEKRILRPANLAPGCPGSGWGIFKTSDGDKVGVINLQGRVFMEAIECPFRASRDIVDKIRKETNVIIVDMHAEATSEKIALGYFLDGTVSAVLGTHTHVQTADEKILPNGTAFISDVGMTGPCDSVIGRRKEDIIERFLTGMPIRFEVADKDIQLQGVIVDIDPKTGKSSAISRLIKKVAV